MNHRPVALVTGAGRGLGLEIARQLTARDLHVLLAARSGEQAQRAADHINAATVRRAEPVVLDVTNPDSIHRATANALDTHGRIDVLINNAGITDGNQAVDSPDLDTVTDVLDTNLLGAWRCATAVIPSMRRHQHGHIINISSHLGTHAEMTNPSEPAYRISKASLNALTQLLAAALDGTGILVNAASPGWIRTDMGGPHAPATVEEGADTPVWLATLPHHPDNPTGQLFHQRHPIPW